MASFDIKQITDNVPLVETHKQSISLSEDQSTDSAWISQDAPQARLFLGMSAVGCWVILSLVGLTTLSVPTTVRPLPEELTRLTLYLLCYVAISLPFDWIGGSLIPRTFDSSPVAPFWRRWARGALLHGLFLFAIASTLLTTSRLGGASLTLIAFVLITLLLISAQKTIASIVASLPEQGRSKNLEGFTVLALRSSNMAFSGGVVGWPGHETIVQPATWQPQLPQELYRHLTDRRALAIKTGQRTRGLLAAFAWVTTGIVLALFLHPEGIQNSEALLRLTCHTTLWQFLGLLLLPTLSRQAAIRLDYEQIQTGFSKQQQREFIRQQSKLEDGEDQRSHLVETIFHPLPSVVNRLKELDREPQFRGAWNANRVMLYLNWASLGLLSRSVHCNVGRPELWVLPPVD